MALNSINTNIGAYYAQQNIGQASAKASLSIARLSSGNRIVQASDDVAALSTGTSLRTQVTTLRTALLNTAQGSSLLQVADGALAQVTDILQRQKALAVQANSGSVGDSERAFLNQEFQNLSAEIDRLADSTSFNGVKLLNGDVFAENQAVTNTASGTRATGGFAIQKAAFTAGKKLTINGVSFVGGTDFQNGSTIEETVNNAVTALNASTNVAVSKNIYRANGAVIEISARSGNDESSYFVTDAASTDAITVGALVTGTTYSTSGVDGIQANIKGIGVGRTVGSGTIGDALITAQLQTKASNIVTFTGQPANADTITIAGQAFTFTTAAAASNTDVQIGAGGTNTDDDLNTTINNLVAALNRFAGQSGVAPSGAEQFAFEQISARREGFTAVIESNAFGAITDTAAAALTVAEAATNVTVSAATIVAGTTTGITTNGITNSEFTGTIQGFKATYTGTPDTVNLEVTVGGIKYTATSVDTTPTANTTVRFLSQAAGGAGGYFDIQLASGQGTAVTGQSGADTFASRLDAAFSTINFFQTRDVTSFEAAGGIVANGTVIGSLTGSQLLVKSDSFDSFNVTDVRVSAPPSGVVNGIIEFDVLNDDGTTSTFRSSATVGDTLGAYSINRFTDVTNPNKYIELRLGATDTFIRNDQEAQAVEDALKEALGFNEGGAELTFQVGGTSDDTLSVSIGTATTSNLFGGQTLDVLTQESAQNASSVLEAAIATITSIRADVGALQSRFNYASNNIQSSIQNQDAARGVLLDTDIAAESTAFATQQVQLQAGISVLAQANLLPQNLLKLIG